MSDIEPFQVGGAIAQRLIRHALSRPHVEPILFQVQEQ
jgi:hypothetical protein